MERAENLGNSVGYQIRLEKYPSREHGSILFCTTNILLQIMKHDPALKGFSHVILDEFHERIRESDFVITLLKHIIPKITEFTNHIKTIKMSEPCENVSRPKKVLVLNKHCEICCCKKEGSRVPDRNDARSALENIQKQFKDILTKYITLINSVSAERTATEKSSQAEQDELHRSSVEF